MRNIMSHANKIRPADRVNLVALITKSLAYLTAITVALLILALTSTEYAHASRQLIEKTETYSSITKAYEERNRKDWDLSKEEWDRYISIMKGPRGLWSPDLDPIMALGIEARTEKEKMKYAVMAAEQELKRVDKELAFQKAYDKAIHKIMKDRNLTLFDTEMIKNRKKTRRDLREPGDRIVFITKLDCSECGGMLKKLAKQAELESGLSVDIYTVGTTVDDNKKIRQWATKNEISERLVKARKITINHDSEMSSALGLTKKDIPALLLRKTRTGHLKPIKMIDLGL